MRYLHLIASITLLAGCATTSLPIDKARPIPAEARTWVDSTADDAAMVVLARDAGFAGIAAYTIVSIDGTKAAKLDRGQKTELKVTPGRRTFLFLAYGDLATQQRPQSMDVDLLPSATVILRIGFNDRGQMSFWRDQP